MKEAWNAMARALGDQAIALGAVADQLGALKQSLARQFPDMADDLKSQVESDHEKNRTGNYDFQVSLAKLREAIAQLPESDTRLEPAPGNDKARQPSKAPARKIRPQTSSV